MMRSKKSQICSRWTPKERIREVTRENKSLKDVLEVPKPTPTRDPAYEAASNKLAAYLQVAATLTAAADKAARGQGSGKAADGQRPVQAADGQRPGQARCHGSCALRGRSTPAIQAANPESDANDREEHVGGGSACKKRKKRKKRKTRNNDEDSESDRSVELGDRKDSEEEYEEEQKEEDEEEYEGGGSSSKAHKGNTPKGKARKGNTPKGNPPQGNTPKGNTPKGNTPEGKPRTETANPSRKRKSSKDTTPQESDIPASVPLATPATPPPFGTRQKLIAQPRTPINSASAATSEVLTSEEKENAIMKEWILEWREKYTNDVHSFKMQNKREPEKKHSMTPKEYWCPNGVYRNSWRGVSDFHKYVLLNVPIEVYIKKQQGFGMYMWVTGLCRLRLCALRALHAYYDCCKLRACMPVCLAAAYYS
jgi:hypothetical protein